MTKEAAVNRIREPYLGVGVDGCLRSRNIDLSEADTMDPSDPRQQMVFQSAREWLAQAYRFQTVARQVLWHFHAPQFQHLAEQPGSFQASLMELFAKADPANRRLLSSVYPATGMYMSLAMDFPDGLHRVAQDAQIREELPNV